MTFFFTAALAFAIIHGAALSSRGQNLVAADTPVVDWCDVARRPKKFSGKLIRLRTVLIENHNPGIFDGANPQLYGPKCLDQTFTTTIRWFGSSYNSSSAHEDLDRARKIQDRFFVSRTDVILVGTFHGPHKRRYLDSFDSEFVIRDVQTATSVVPNAPWPKWLEELKEKLRGPTNRLDASGGSVVGTNLVRRRVL